jgi:hypothetical protein
MVEREREKKRLSKKREREENNLRRARNTTGGIADKPVTE